MLSQCANPACTAPFRYLHEGRIFTMVSAASDTALSGLEAWEHSPSRPYERYWLCERCAQTMTVAWFGDRVAVRPLPPPPRMPPRPARSEHKVA